MDGKPKYIHLLRKTKYGYFEIFLSIDIEKTEFSDESFDDTYVFEMEIE